MFELSPGCVIKSGFIFDRNWLLTETGARPNRPHERRRITLSGRPWRHFVLIWREIARRHDAGVKVRAGRGRFFGDHEMAPGGERANLDVPVRKHDDRPIADVHENRGHQPGIG